MPSKSRPVHTLDLGKRGIPTNTRVSERNSSKPKLNLDHKSEILNVEGPAEERTKLKQFVQGPNRQPTTMAETPGSWTPRRKYLGAFAVLEATKASGNLYRNGLGMIASENIVSPMYRKWYAAIYMADMLRVFQAKDITKVAMILTIEI